MQIGNIHSTPYSGNQMFSRLQTQKFPHQQAMPYGQGPPPTSQCGICGKNFNLELNLPKLLPCGHSFCLFCLTAMETQSGPSITIECPYCMIKYSHVPASHFDTNYDIVMVLEKVQQTLQQQQMQLPQYAQPGVYPPPGIGGGGMYSNYSSPPKLYKSNTMFNTTPPRFIHQQQNYDIRQVSQIFENMKLDAMNKSPAQNRIKQFQYDASPSASVKHSPLTGAGNLKQVCCREGCTNLRAFNGDYQANYCSKTCEALDQNQGAFSKNQDAIYLAAAMNRNKSRSKSPLKMNNFDREDYSPLRGGGGGGMMNQQRSRSPYSRSAINQLKKHSIFSSESDSEGGLGNQQQVNMTPQAQRSGNFDPAIRRLNFDRGQVRSNVQNYQPATPIMQQQNQIQNTMGVFGESAFDKFMKSKTMNEEQINYIQTPSPHHQGGFAGYAQGNQFIQFSRPNTSGGMIFNQQHQQPYYNDTMSKDTRIDLNLAPNDPMKCLNPQCRNRKFLLNDQYLPVCSRACSHKMNIQAFPM